MPAMAWPVSDRHARMAGMTAGRPRLLSGDFGRFWLGQTISNLGSSFTFFALPLLVEAGRHVLCGPAASSA
jgi:hypothetical protein